MDSNITLAQALEALKALTPSELTAALKEAGIQTSSGVAGKVTLKIKEGCKLFMRGVPGTNGQFGATLFIPTVLWILDNAESLKGTLRQNKASLVFRSERDQDQFDRVVGQ